MKITKTFHIIAGLLFLSVLTTHGRIGETQKQCDERYGEIKFKNLKGVLEYRSYRFNGKQIRSVFYNGECVFEAIVSGPHPLEGTEQGRALSREFIRFSKALLSNAYGFSDSQLEGMGVVKHADGHVITWDSCTHGDIKAMVHLTLGASEESMSFTLTVGRPPEGINWKQIADFYYESEALELKDHEKERAKGF